MDPLTLMIAKSAGTVLLKLGKAGVLKLLTEPLLHKAATDTQLDFEGLEIREALVTWAGTEDVAGVLENLKDGKRDHFDSLASKFVETTGFYDGETTHDKATSVVEAFIGRVLDLLLESPQGLVYVAHRLEQATTETQAHITKEADRTADKIASIWFGSEAAERVRKEFDYQTDVAQKNIKVEIVGITGSLERPEVSFVESQFRLETPVILNGEPGTGKTGAALLISRSASAAGKQVLYIDARRVQDVQNETELRGFYRVDEPLSRTIEALSGQGFRLIIDQFDNIVNRKIGGVLVELASQCAGFPGVEVLVVSRSREGYESELVRRLTDQGFVAITCRPLTPESSLSLLNSLGLKQPTDELVELCRNLLNLDIVATIKKEQPAFDFSDVLNEVVL